MGRPRRDHRLAMIDIEKKESTRQLVEALLNYIDAAVEARLSGSPSARDMVEKYGEIISRTAAAELLHVTPKTITQMVNDKRLNGSAGGISVRSIARYIDEGKPSAVSFKRYGWPSQGGRFA